MKKMKINEIFYSIQGEGYWTGTPMIFIRFSGCNLKCPFCDTDHSAYSEMDIDGILGNLAGFGQCKRICITGGEPSIQLDKELVRALHEKGFLIHVETNGTNKLPDGIDWTTVSPKTENIALESADELKIVYQGQDVSKWEHFPAQVRYLQPCSCRNTEEVVSFVMRNPLWRLSLQTQKYLDIR